MNDVKDILNKMKFVPEEIQDKVLENIKKSIEQEIYKSYNPIDLLVQRLKELKFGEEENSINDDIRIIRIINNRMPADWFYMKPIYCESIEKKNDNGFSYKINPDYERFIDKEISKRKDRGDLHYLITHIAQESKNSQIDVIKDSYWVYKDGANGEIWFYKTKQFAKEMLYWFEDCFYVEDEDELECAYEILNRLEEAFPKS